MYRPLFMPFSILELDIDYRNTREIQKIVEARTVLPLQNIYTDPVKNAETLFLAEMLGQTLKEPEPNPQLFAFVAQAIQVLNLIDEGKANFHLCFLLQLCSFLGFSPNMESYRPDYCFDMLNGIFTSSRPLHAYVLAPREAESSPSSPAWISTTCATSTSTGANATPCSTAYSPTTACTSPALANCARPKY